MKILLINQTFYPDCASTAQHLTDFAEDLASEGHEVTVLTSQRSYDNPSKMLSRYEKRRGVEIIRAWQTGFGKSRKIGRMLDALSLNVAFAWKLLWLKRHNKIIVMTSPPLVGWIAAICARLLKSELIYWIMDIQPDEAIVAGWIRKGSLYARLLEKILKYVLNESRKVIVLDEFMRERILSKFAGIERRIEVIAPWSHDDDLETIAHENNPFRISHGLSGKFIIMYSGNHSLCHPLDTLLGASVLLKKDPDIAFVFIGGGERVKDVIGYQRRYELCNLFYFPYQERTYLKNSLSAANVHIVAMGKEFSGIVHPCKIYGILKIGRPFIYIGPEKSHIGQIIKVRGIGYRVDHGEPNQLVKIIQEIRSFDAKKLNGIKGQEHAASAEYSKELLTKKMKEYVFQEP